MTQMLSERAMLADLSIGYWTGRKKSKRATEQTVRDAHADQDAGAWWTRLIPPRKMKRMDAAITKARAAHWAVTLPWANDGARILPAKMFLQYTQTMRECRAEFDAALEEFVGNYPMIVSEAKNRLGSLYEAGQYPTVNRIRRSFYWRVDLLPLPAAADFRVALGDDTVAQVRQEIETQVNGRLGAATRDLWSRLHSAISHVAERLSNPDNIFRDSLIGNVKELCDLLPNLNITDDPNLEAARQEIEKKIADLKPDELRNDQRVRSDAADTAKKILEGMAAFLPKEETE